jgi:hypothetical protein
MNKLTKIKDKWSVIHFIMIYILRLLYYKH